jgi:DNA-binding transcriptional MocR family regulator
MEFVDVDCGYYKRCTGIPEDQEGVNIEVLQRHLDEFEQEPSGEKPAWQKCTFRYVFYGVPTFSNPTGSVMSLARRKALVDVDSARCSGLMGRWRGSIIFS